MNQVLEWINPEELHRNMEIKNRGLFAREHHPREATAIVQKYTNLTIEETNAFLRYVISTLGIEFKGTGVELGAGVGGISNSVLSLCPAVEKIYAVEIVPEVVNLLQVKIKKQQDNEQRLISVIGSFDDIKLPDNSVDFIVEFDSLHHSFDLSKTLREAYRVLKPGGMLVALDRMQSNALTEAQREFMLNVEYGEPFKIDQGMPLDITITRGQNGEHEISESEWRSAFRQSGFSLDQCVTFQRKSLRALAYGIISQIPFSIRAKYNFYPMLVRFPLSFFLFYGLPFLPVLWKKRVLPFNISFAQRGAFFMKTVFIASKP